MEYIIRSLISFVLLFNIGLEATLIIEEEPDSKGVHNGEQPGKHSVRPSVSIFTIAEKKILLTILEKLYKSNGLNSKSFEKFSESLSQYLHSPPIKDKQPMPPNEPPPPSPHGQCRTVGYSCNAGGWSFKEMSEEDAVETEEENDNKNGSWESDENFSSHEWGNHGKCCNDYWCQYGKCCIPPTPPKRSSSYCMKDTDCCDGGLCDEGRCLKSRGSPCTESNECYKSKCVNNICCIPNSCANDTRAYHWEDFECSVKTDCCGDSICRTSSGECIIIVGLGGDCSCEYTMCHPGYNCDAGKCCNPLNSCTNGNQCCRRLNL